jgi:polyferredoxin
MDMNRISSYPEHPEPDGRDAEFNRERRPRSSAWGVATVGVAAFVMVVGFFSLLAYSQGGVGFLLVFGGGSILLGTAFLLVGLYLMLVVFAPQNTGNTE